MNQFLNSTLSFDLIRHSAHHQHRYDTTMSLLLPIQFEALDARLYTAQYAIQLLLFHQQIQGLTPFLDLNVF